MKINYESQPIYVYIDSNYVKTFVRVNVLPSSYSPNKKYAWYSSNQIIETQGGASGKLLHGKYESFWPNKNLLEKGNYKDGLRVGNWLKWNTNGNLANITHWSNGMKNGKYVVYNLNGFVKKRGRYYHDQLCGITREYENGKLVAKYKYKKDLIVKKYDVTKSKKSEKIVAQDSTKQTKKNHAKMKKIMNELRERLRTPFLKVKA